MVVEEMLHELDNRLVMAVEYFWDMRAAQQQKQREEGNANAGGRGAVTGGRHMAALEKLIGDILVAAELPDLTVRIKTSEPGEDSKKKKEQLELPGYYRPEKKWDLVALSREQLVAAVEFKGQVGPSFGNNVNNRAEEAIGTAEDLWKAYREERFGNSPEPFLGYIFLLEDCPKVHKPVRLKEPFFSVDPEFKRLVEPTGRKKSPKYEGVSYSERYELLCRRLRLERLYTSTCLILSSSGPNPQVTCPAEDLSFRAFVAKLIGHAHTFVLSQVQ